MPLRIEAAARFPVKDYPLRESQGIADLQNSSFGEFGSGGQLFTLHCPLAGEQVSGGGWNNRR